MRRIVLHIIPVIMLMSTAALSGQAERKFIRQGNREYRDSAFDESEILYRKALEKDKDNYTGGFNLGDALYKQDKFEDAARSFNNLAEGESDKQKLGHLYHNLGNSLLNAQQLEASIEAYKEALRNNPYDEETRYNLAYAQQMLQQQQEQQQQQNQDQDQDQNQQDQNQQDQEPQDQEQNQEQQPQDQEPNQEQQPQDQEPQDQQISREDAERMLQALQQDDQKLQEKIKKQQAGAKRIRVLKDW